MTPQVSEIALVTFERDSDAFDTNEIEIDKATEVCFIDLPTFETSFPGPLTSLHRTI